MADNVTPPAQLTLTSELHALFTLILALISVFSRVPGLCHGPVPSLSQPATGALSRPLKCLSVCWLQIVSSGHSYSCVCWHTLTLPSPQVANGADEEKKRPSGEDTVPVETYLEGISEVTTKVTDVNTSFL